MGAGGVELSAQGHPCSFSEWLPVGPDFAFARSFLCGCGSHTAASFFKGLWIEKEVT